MDFLRWQRAFTESHAQAAICGLFCRRRHAGDGGPRGAGARVVVHQQSRLADEVGVEVVDHEVVGFHGFASFDGGEPRWTLNRVERRLGLERLGHLPALAVGPETMAEGGGDGFAADG